MGYDMHWVEKDPDEGIRMAAIRDQWEMAVKERDAYPEKAQWNPSKNGDEEFTGDPEAVRLQSRVRALSAEMYAAEESYFRLNIWGMDECREAMVGIGMAFDWGNPDPWPDIPDEEDFANYDAYKEAYNKATLEHRSAHGPEIPGIPVGKFCSNDGWLVLPAECMSAVKIWEEELAKSSLEELAYKYPAVNYEWWPKWIAYLRGAATHGGFEVH